MKNIFSANEQAPELDPAFQQQVPANLVNAPATPDRLPARQHVPLRTPQLENLARHAGERVDWRSTRIGGWGEGSLLAEAERLFQPDWWKPPESAVAAVTRLLDNAQENVERRSGRPVTSKMIAAAQEEDDEIGELVELTPTDTETITEWFARIGASIDFNGHRKILWDVLRSHAARFRGDANAKKTLDARLVQQFLNTALN